MDFIERLFGLSPDGGNGIVRAALLRDRHADDLRDWRGLAAPERHHPPLRTRAPPRVKPALSDSTARPLLAGRRQGPRCPRGAATNRRLDRFDRCIGRPLGVRWLGRSLPGRLLSACLFRHPHLPAVTEAGFGPVATPRSPDPPLTSDGFSWIDPRRAAPSGSTRHSRDAAVRRRSSRAPGAHCLSMDSQARPLWPEICTNPRKPQEISPNDWIRRVPARHRSRLSGPGQTGTRR